MAWDYTNDPRLLYLKEFERTLEHPVLTPHIVRNWPQISALAEEACQVSLSGALDAAEAFKFHTSNAEWPLLPVILRKILAEVDGFPTDEISKRLNSEALRKTEIYLHERGFTTGMLDFFTCGGEALVFSVKGCPDLLLKVSSEYELNTQVPFAVRPFTKAAFSSATVQDKESAFEESKDRFGYTGELSLAFSPFLPMQYTDVWKIGESSAAHYNHRAEPPQWAVPIHQKMMERLEREPELLAALQAVSIIGGKGMEKQITGIPFPDPSKTLALNDQKYNNFGAYHGFANLPFLLDKRMIGLEGRYVPKYTSARAEPIPQEQTNEYQLYQRFSRVVRDVYQEKYGQHEKAFQTIAAHAASFLEQHVSAAGTEAKLQGLPDAARGRDASSQKIG